MVFLPLHIILKIHRFDPKLSYFSQFKPRNITKTYLSQIINQKLRKLDPTKEKNVNIHS